MGILVLGLVMIFASGCKPAPKRQTATAFATLGSSTATAFDLTGLTAVADGVAYKYDKEDGTKTITVPGYALSDIITSVKIRAKVTDDTTDTDDYRSIFSYAVVGSDGFSQLQRGNAISWAVTEAFGFYLYNNANTDGSFDVPDETGVLPRVAYTVSFDEISSGQYIRDPETIQLYRTITVTIGTSSTPAYYTEIIPETISWSYEKVGSLIERDDDAVSLYDLLYAFIESGAIAAPESAAYQLRAYDYDAADDFTYEDLTYADLENAYFIFKTDANGYIEDDMVVILDENNQANSGQKRPKFVTTIVVQ